MRDLLARDLRRNPDSTVDPQRDGDRCPASHLSGELSIPIVSFRGDHPGHPFE
ncbi:hypothetical protein [Blastococcus sp. TBT05-19]|uniref:hypothetical protein n=1 Tax=Blastococcus sp. TBT05-19 TaxID=2250581 RepID=UPI001314120F|nr:hypothetical protein [Blastococcus sp. TBT05-19]